MNQSDIYNRQYEVYKYDLLEPEEKLYVGYKPPRHVPIWAMKIPDYLVRRELTEIEKEEREDDFLRKHGIK